MQGEWIATAGAREMTLSVEPHGSQWKIHLDGRELVVDAVRIRPGTWSLLLDGRSILVDVDESKEPPQIHTHQAVTPILLENAQRKRLAEAMGKGRGGAAKGELIKAPIAGRVVKVLVEVGDTVEAGSCVAILEAMKMENEIKCQRGGLVDAVHVGAGDSVETGAKLLGLKAAPAS